MQVYTCQAEGWREQGGTRHIRTRHDTIGHLLRVECLSIQYEFGVEFPRSLAVKYGHDRIAIHTEDGLEGGQVRGEGHNGAYIQVTVGPAV